MDDTSNEYLSYCAKNIKRNKMFLAKVVIDTKNGRKRAKISSPTKLRTPKKIQSSKEMPINKSFQVQRNKWRRRTMLRKVQLQRNM